jgi:hypothetical protein
MTIDRDDRRTPSCRACRREGDTIVGYRREPPSHVNPPGILPDGIATSGFNHQPE